jgi:hypothetical protein
VKTIAQLVRACLRRRSKANLAQESEGTVRSPGLKIAGNLCEGPMTRTLKSLFALAAVAVIIGHVDPEQRADIEPRNQALPLWFKSEGAQVLVRACGNCHSNHTDWPWYSHVAPVSWWIARHVREGRERLDFSEWETYSSSERHDKLESICGLISTGRMPPRLYSAMHPEAKLTEAEKKRVCAWVKEETIVAR